MLIVARPIKVKELIALLQKCDPDKEVHTNIFLRSGFPNDEDDGASGAVASVLEAPNKVYIEAVSHTYGQ